MDWTQRSQVTDDVVFFRYVTEGVEKNADEVFVWDLDKTYLDTSIDSLRALMITIMERALNKRNIPGTKTLLQVISRRYADKFGAGRFPIYFITASPPQIEERIAEKFAFDQIRPFGCFYKDNLRNLQPKRFWRLTKQVGYKLQALLQLRLHLQENVRQTFWGDDSESDAIIYNLYSDICSRRKTPAELRALLKYFFVTGEQMDRILQIQAQIPENDPVEKIYINLAVDTDADYYLKFGRRTLPTENTFQVAIDLYQDQRLSLEDVYTVAQDMIYNYNYTPEQLSGSFNDLIRRHILGDSAVEKLLPFLVEKGLLAKDFKPAFAVPKEVTVDGGRVKELEGHFEPWIQQSVDYLHDYR